MAEADSRHVRVLLVNHLGLNDVPAVIHHTHNIPVMVSRLRILKDVEAAHREALCAEEVQ